MKPILKEIKDNCERVLLQLENGHLAGIKEISHGCYNVVEQRDWFNNGTHAIELTRGYNRDSCFGYNIDKIKFLADRHDVDTFLQYEECEIDWDWDINTQNLKFKKGDVVRVCNEEFRQSYKQVLGKIGTIVDAEYAQLLDDERITYRVRVDNYKNEYQEQGLWVFHDESSLERYEEDPSITQLRQMAGYIDDCIAQVVSNKETTINTFNIKGDNNNMFNEILEIYEEKQSRKINKKYNDLEKSIKLTDARYKMWKECVDTLDKLYTEDKVLVHQYAEIELSEDTKKKLQVLYTAREQDLRKLLDKKHEVNAQLDMCETYDQKQEILRRYNIINKNGKVNG